MVKTRFRIQDIKSYSPAIDVRNDDSVYVIDGKNYVFTSKGPKSGFGTRLLASGQVIGDPIGIAQSIEMGNRCFVMVRSGIYELSADGTVWNRIYDLTTFQDIPFLPEKKWTSAYLMNGMYFAHVNHGLLKLTFDGVVPLNQETTPGLPFEPVAIAETNGRLIVLGRRYVAWSGPSAAEDFAPALGGAGQILLSDRIPGDPMTLAAFQGGFLVWTDQGCLLAEFVGGDLVFRFTRVSTEQLPLDANCVESLPDGSQILCTEQGLYQIKNGQEPVKLVPVFSEFIREFLKHEDGIHARLTYQPETDWLFVQIRDWTNHYVRTFVLSVSIDKWGQFSDRHLGVIKWSADRGAYGYIDLAGVGHKFIDVFNREVTPHAFEGLDSNMVIGYIKPPELHGEIDSLLEMQEIFIGGKARPSWSVPIDIDLGDLPEPTPPDDSFKILLDYDTGFYYALGAEQALTDVVANPGETRITAGLGYQVVNQNEDPLPPDISFLSAVGDELFANKGAGLTFVFEVDRRGVFHDWGFGMTLADTNYNQEYDIKLEGYGSTTSPYPELIVFVSGGPNIIKPYSQLSGYKRYAFSAIDDWFTDITSFDTDINGIQRWVISFGKEVSPGLFEVCIALNGVLFATTIQSADVAFGEHWLDAAVSFIMSNADSFYYWSEGTSYMRKIEIHEGMDEVATIAFSATGIPLSVQVEPPEVGFFGVWDVASGVATDRVSGTDADFNDNGIRFHGKIVPLAKAKQGIPYPGCKIQAYGGKPPYSYAATGLPDGLVIDSVTGDVTGTPTTLGAFATIQFTATDSLGASVSTGPYSITVQDSLIELLIDHVRFDGSATSGMFVITQSIPVRAPEAGKFLLISLALGQVNSAGANGIIVTVNGVAATCLGVFADVTTSIPNYTFRQMWVVGAPATDDIVDLVIQVPNTALTARVITRLQVYRVHGFDKTPTEVQVNPVDIVNGEGSQSFTVDVPANSLVLMLGEYNVPFTITDLDVINTNQEVVLAGKEFVAAAPGQVIAIDPVTPTALDFFRMAVAVFSRLP